MKKELFFISIVFFSLVGCGGSGGVIDDENHKDQQEKSDDKDSGAITQNGSYTLLAWNDLGMHCVDGKDYSIFSILPPYNTLNAQLIRKDGTEDKHVRSGVTVTYESEQGLDGSLNSSSLNKTNFWDYAFKLFGIDLVDDTGLTGNKTASTTPSPLKYIAQHEWWEASGIPIMNYNDDGSKNYYPLVKVVAKDSSGKILASTKVVLPVSDEMDCRKCHGSNSVAKAMPTTGWENSRDVLKDYKLNILKLHDEKHTISKAVLDELSTKGYNYQASLYDTVKAGTPILCATCHKSNALKTSGVGDIPPLTTALHKKHADVIDPTTNQKLNDSTNRSACYTCHPGATTKCLRGAMGNVNEIQCQSCHGGMDAVGSDNREGWLDEPNCQNCHHDGKRDTMAVIDFQTGTLRDVLDKRFATNPNTPSSGHSLYRYSKGHGDMKCSSCHGSTHSIYPSSHKEDNLQSIAIQGFAGTVSECTACHTTMPKTNNKGPHGMHSIGQTWVKDHENYAEKNRDLCTACHGVDFRGSDLSKTFTSRSFNTKDFGIKTYKKGQKVSCYDCHNGPDGE
jgi:hypothetical protein